MTERRQVSVLGDLALIGLMKVIISAYSHTGTQGNQVCDIFFPMVSKVFLGVKIQLKEGQRSQHMACWRFLMGRPEA